VPPGVRVPQRPPWANDARACPPSGHLHSCGRRSAGMCRLDAGTGRASSRSSPSRRLLGSRLDESCRAGRYPGSVQIRLAGHSKLCRNETCWIHFNAVVTTNSQRGIYARDCSVRALDQAGRVVAEGGAALGFPPGAYTRAGEPYRMMGGTQVRVDGEGPVRVASLEATCSAYVWHGDVPI
jgi:hypothetical protein